jgi:tRNA(Ile)-lysidine synthase
MTVIETVLQWNSKKHLFTEDDSLLLTVSGGIDSMVMMELFSHFPNRIAIAHCNFQLRGDESDKDEELVRQTARKKSIPFFCQKFDTQSFATQKHISIQMAARELRYQWFEELSNKHRFTKILTAHHQDDNIETFIIHLLRSSGLKGLQGIPVQRGLYIRPLLGLSRKEIEAYASTHQVPYRDDKSNRETKYLRNKIRHLLLPALYNIDAHYASKFQKSMDILQQSNVFIEEKMQEMIARHSSVNNHQTRFSRTTIKKCKHASLLLFYWLHPYGFSEDSIREILQNNNLNKTGNIFYSAEYLLNIDRDFLILSPQKKSDNIPNIIKEKTGKLNDLIPLEWETFDRTKDFRFSTERNTGDFDFDDLHFPLLVRRWKAGDRFYPLGMKGSKLVSDILTDIKLSRVEKMNTCVLLSGEKIVWVIGYRQDERFKITGKTKRIVRIRRM